MREPLLDCAVEMPAFHARARMLFQGDSVTDGNRVRRDCSDDPTHILGDGYVSIIAAKYGARFPDRQLAFFNRGNSGDNILRLTERWQQDTLALNPSLLSILIGVNDNKLIRTNEEDEVKCAVPVDQYVQSYDQLLQKTITALPNICLVLCEPFMLPVGPMQSQWELRSAAIKQRQDIVRQLAVKYRATFVELQHVFDEACQLAPASYWIWDGLHPTYPGHQLIADAWELAVRSACRR